LFNSNSVISDNVCVFNEFGPYSNVCDYSTGKVLPFPQPVENTDWYENPASSSRYRATTNNTFPYYAGYPPQPSGCCGYHYTRFFYESANQPGTTNLVSDPSMEGSGSCGWGVQSSPTNGLAFEVSTNVAFHGTQSLKVTAIQDYEMYTNNATYVRCLRKVADVEGRLTNSVFGCYIYPTTTNLVCSMQMIGRFDGSDSWAANNISPKYVLQTGQWNHVQAAINWWPILKSVDPSRPWTNLPNGALLQITLENDQFHPIHSNDVIYIDNVYFKSGTDLSPIICSD
jgi:hypothetical protein